MMVGIGEPSFYVNDYQEMIYLYGIDHKKSMEQCEKMIAFYEENLEDNVVISHTRSTRELMNAYEGTLDFSTEEVLWWMGGRADWFKGYSQTALNYVKQYRDSILSWSDSEGTVNSCGTGEKTVKALAWRCTGSGVDFKIYC